MRSSVFYQRFEIPVRVGPMSRLGRRWDDRGHERKGTRCLHVCKVVGAVVPGNFVERRGDHGSDGFILDINSADSRADGQSSVEVVC